MELLYGTSNVNLSQETIEILIDTFIFNLHGVCNVSNPMSKF